MSSPLFTPINLAGLRLPNRIVMAPMSRYFCPDGVPTPEVAAYYARRASGGCGLIITEGTYVGHPSAHSYAGVPHFHGARALEGWRAVVRQVQAAGGRIFPQLWHTGSFRELGMGPDPSVPGFGPSDDLNAFERTTHPTRPMSDNDISEVIDAYAEAAAQAQAMGCDGIEIHGAHGYLIDAFFWSVTNRRTDHWGGTEQADRARFGAEVVHAIRRRTGPDFPISFRWSQFKQQDYRARLCETPQALEALLGPLVDAGVTVFHASTRRFWEPAFADQSPLTLAGWTRAVTGRPAIAVGSVGLAGVARPTVEPGQTVARFGDAELDGVDQLETLMAQGEFDLIAVGRAILADPDWCRKVENGRLADRARFDKRLLDVLH